MEAAASRHRVRALALAREEIRALPRQTFALGAVAFVLAALAPFSGLVLDGPDALREYLIFMWLIGQLVVAIVLAGRIAAARRARFVESLYTTPLEARSWLGAQFLVGAFMAALVIVTQLPFILVHVALVGVPPMLGPLFLAALGMGAFAVAFGAFCGVVVGESGAGAAAGLAGGVGFVTFVMFLVHGMASGLPPTPTQEIVLRLTALSPLALVVDATGTGPFARAPETPWRAVVGLGSIVVGLGAAAWLAYTRAQGPLGWEPRRARVGVVALVALALVLPVASASVTYVEVEEEGSYVLAHGEHTRVSFVPSGTPITDAQFSLAAAFYWEDLVHGQDNELDALVMLLVPADEQPRQVRIGVAGSPQIQVVSGGSLEVADGSPAGRARAGETFGKDTEPTGPLRPVYRVPVVLRPVEASALQGSHGHVEVDTLFVLSGRTLESHARVTLESDIPGASIALLLAGAPLPLVAIGSLVTRRFRTR